MTDNTTSTITPISSPTINVDPTNDQLKSTVRLILGMLAGFGFLSKFLTPQQLAYLQSDDFLHFLAVGLAIITGAWGWLERSMAKKQLITAAVTKPEDLTIKGLPSDTLSPLAPATLSPVLAPEVEVEPSIVPIVKSPVLNVGKGHQPTQDIVAAAQAAQKNWHVPAAISIAQYALESSWGTHMPEGSYNPFGIKAISNQPSVRALTREVINGKDVYIPQDFRKFGSIAEAFDAHAELLANGKAYAAARGYLHNLNLSSDDDVDGYANALTGHYATDPKYGALLIKIIKGSDLTRYDA